MYFMSKEIQVMELNMFNTIKYSGKTETRKFLSGNADLAAFTDVWLLKKVWGCMRSILRNIFEEIRRNHNI